MKYATFAAAFDQRRGWRDLRHTFARTPSFAFCDRGRGTSPLASYEPRAGLTRSPGVERLALPSPALAEGSVSLAYEAPEGCPAQPDFVAAVAARGGAFEGEGAAGSHRVMVVAIRRDNRGFAGAFQVRDAGPPPTSVRSTAKHAARSSTPWRWSPPSPSDPIRCRRHVARSRTSPRSRRRRRHPRLNPRPPWSRLPTERLRGHTQIFPPRTEKVEVGAGTLRFDLQRSYMVSGGVVVGPGPLRGHTPTMTCPSSRLNFVTTPEGAQRIAGLVFRLHVSLMLPATYRSADTYHRFEWGVVRHRPLPISPLRHPRAGALVLR